MHGKIEYVKGMRRKIGEGKGMRRKIEEGKGMRRKIEEGKGLDRYTVWSIRQWQCGTKSQKSRTRRWSTSQ